MKRASIDWRAVQEQLRASELALEETMTPSPQRVRDAYRQRAARLATVDLNLKPASPGLPTLVFLLGQERYAIEMKELAEVLPFVRCTQVPGGSQRFLGVINLRGEIRAVLDLRNLVAPSESGDGEAGFVLMLRRPGKEVGLKVDHIEDLREIRPEELTLSPQGTYGKGMASGTLMLLNVDAVLKEAFSKEEQLTA
jgi:purine-binding chemotaxis protein CheW